MLYMLMANEANSILAELVEATGKSEKQIQDDATEIYGAIGDVILGKAKKLGYTSVEATPGVLVGDAGLIANYTIATAVAMRLSYRE